MTDASTLSIFQRKQLLVETLIAIIIIKKKFRKVLEVVVIYIKIIHVFLIDLVFRLLHLQVGTISKAPTGVVAALLFESERSKEKPAKNENLDQHQESVKADSLP